MEINENNLKVSDIILVKEKKNFFMWLIRKLTKSNWNHAVMICFTQDEGYLEPFLIESSWGGVDIHPFSTLLDTKRYDLMIRRCEKSWFDPNKVRALALEEIDSGYATNLLFSILFDILKRTKFKLIHKSYICSGFIQWMYYMSTDINKDEVIFTNVQDLGKCTPEDLASTDKLVSKWTYIDGNFQEYNI